MLPGQKINGVAPSDFWWGHLELNPRSALEFFAEEMPALFTDFKWVYVRCVDSQSSELLASPTLQAASEVTGEPLQPLGGGLRITQSAFLFMATALRVFNGFDQAWFADGIIAEPLPDSVDFAFHKPLVLPLIVAWMRRNNVLLGLQDGIGIDCITTDFSLAEQIQYLEPEGTLKQAS